MSAGLALDALVVRAARELGPFTLDVPKGTSLAILGEAGSGTSSVLAVLSGARRPLAGSVVFDGGEVDPLSVGFVTQTHDLLGGLTAAENVAMAVLARTRGAIAWTDIEATLDALGLAEPTWHNLLEQLSGGQQQRVAIARALAPAPALLCLDQPTSELDERSALVVRDLLRARGAAGAVVVVATTDAEEAAAFDQVLRID